MLGIESDKVMRIQRRAKSVSIPCSVTCIGQYACFNGSLVNLNLENTKISIIKKYAFSFCYCLEEVAFPSCLEEICEGAFCNCKCLKHISFLPQSKLRKIGPKAFHKSYDLEPFGFPPLLEFIGNNAFEEFEILDLRKTKVRQIGVNVFWNLKNVYYPSTIEVQSVINTLCNNIDIDESHPIIKKNKCGYYFSNRIIIKTWAQKKHILIRRGVERIANHCFYKSYITSVSIPSSVEEIGENTFKFCHALHSIRFHKDSRLKIINESAFDYCESLKKIFFPRSLKILKKGSFSRCRSLEKVIFSQDSQLERIEHAFFQTRIKILNLPPSVKEIIGVTHGMIELESLFVSNNYYRSNIERSAIFSKDGSELVCVNRNLDHFEIPEGVRIIKKLAFSMSLISGYFIIPASVEVIEEYAFYNMQAKILEFSEGSRLKSLSLSGIGEFEDLIINNENFFKSGKGVVISNNPLGIVFVPCNLRKLKIPYGIEVIYSYTFHDSGIKNIKFPQSLKKICASAIYYSYTECVEIYEGTEIEVYAFIESKIKRIKFLSRKFDISDHDLIDTKAFDGGLITELIFPVSMIPTIARLDFFGEISFTILDDTY